MKDAPETYAPNRALAWVYQRFFENIEVDQAWAGRVREADARGTVVYVLRNLSFVDFLALDYLTKSLRLPQVRFANDLGLWLLEPLGRGWLSALRPRREEDDVGRLRQAIDGGPSAGGEAPFGCIQAIDDFELAFGDARLLEAQSVHRGRLSRDLFAGRRVEILALPALQRPGQRVHVLGEAQQMLHHGRFGRSRGCIAGGGMVE